MSMIWLHGASCKHLVKFCPRVVGVHLLVNQFSYRYVRLAAPLLDAAGISTEFCGAISTEFCFTYLLRGITAMPRGIHARLCHAFLVLLYFTCANGFRKDFVTCFYYRVMHYSAKRGLAITCRLSVRPSVRLSVCDVGGS